MRTFCLAVTLFTATTTFAQVKNLYGVAFMQPKSGQSVAFETSWKNHLAKYHNGDSKRAVYEIITGDNSGMFQIVEGPFSFADMDKEQANDKVHTLDFVTNLSAKLDQDKEGYTYRFLDTMSYNYKDVVASKYQQSIVHIKPEKLAAYLKEVRRSTVINEKIKSPSSYTSYLLLFAGSKPQLVIRTALKDGFKQLEENYFPSTTEAFKAAYIKEYGQADWDSRSAPGAVYTYINALDNCLIKARPDLSSTVNTTAKK